MEHFGIIGISHRRTSTEEIGKVSRAMALLSDLRSNLQLDEMLVLRTCNRVELYWRTEQACPADEMVGRLAELMFPGDAEGQELVNTAAFSLNGESVAKHLFSVLAGMDSIVVGDEQITGQFRESLRKARENGDCGPLLGLLGDAALKLSRQVRREVDFSKLPTSIAEVAAASLRRSFRQRERTRVVLIGAGDMIRITAARLKGWKGAELIFVNRTAEAAHTLAQLHGGEALSLEDFRQAPVDFDAMVIATGAKLPVLAPQDLASLPERAEARLLLDLGVPQDLDPSFGLTQGWDYVDVFKLGKEVEANEREVEMIGRGVRPILRRGLQNFREKVFQRAIAPLASQLRSSVEERADVEMGRALAGGLSHLSAEDRDVVARLCQRVAAQSVQIPLWALRKSLRDLPLGDALIGHLGAEPGVANI